MDWGISKGQEITASTYIDYSRFEYGKVRSVEKSGIFEFEVPIYFSDVDEPAERKGPCVWRLGTIKSSFLVDLKHITERKSWDGEERF